MTREAKTSLNHLSDEIIAEILHCCVPKVILRFAATCNRYLYLVNHSSSLQLYIELVVNQLEIIDWPIKATSSSILRKVSRYRDAWLDLDLGIPVERSITMEHTPCHSHPGMYVKTFSRSGNTRLPDSIQFTSLGSSTMPPPVYFGVEFNECIFEMEQELAVLACIGDHTFDDPGLGYARIHLRSITTGSPHPRAQQPTLTADFRLFSQNGDFRIVTENIGDTLATMGSTLAVMFRFRTGLFGNSGIWIWNWQSGAFLHKIECVPSVYLRFLDKDHLVISSAYSGGVSLVAYDISRPPTPFDAHLYEPRYPTLSPILVFEFPQSGYPLRSAWIPGRVAQTISAALASTRATALELTLSLRPSNGLAKHRSFRIFVSTVKLLDYIEQCRQRSITTLPWDDWGERATRWFVDAFPPHHEVCSISQSRRIIASPPFTLSHGVQYISIIDFNTPTVKRYANRASDSSLALPESRIDVTINKKMVLEGGGMIANRPSEAILEELGGYADNPDKMVYVESVNDSTPTIIRTGFVRPIISRLPYRIVTKLQPVPAHAVWSISENYIVGENELPATGRKNLLVYKLEASTKE